MKVHEIPSIQGGWIALLGAFGSDLDIVNSARISFNKRHEEMEKGDENLIHFLLRNRHGTTFEIPVFRFQVRAPLTVFREWQRHRISSFNEVSGRYVEMKTDSYLPLEIRKQVGKPGNYTYETMSEREITINRAITRLHGVSKASDQRGSQGSSQKCSPASSL